ncbi:protein of unknown function, contains Excisionase family DNA binding domain [Nitrospira defluvii]|jgi:excisionase family DNA binding protein|uniref:Helix-turn-helix domain-containing protein n=1 Tax=Nitrospira defluvii TaxID=330214 RepID=D8PIZ3_9BACT|nr:protein of unknown function, contains Excisionase family DNA binding domain [Nitrospira defluvii]
MLLTVKDLSQELQVNSSTLYAWAKQGKIPCKRLHRLVRFERGEIDTWLASCPNGIPAPLPDICPDASRIDVDALIASAKREVYTPRHGETRPKSSLIRKGEQDGAV